MSVAVVCVAYGEKHIRFLSNWSTAVNNLRRKPDEIIIVTDDLEEAEMWVHWLPGMRIIVNATIPQVHPQVCINDAIAEAESEWICKMDVDDLINPHALDNLDECDADVYMFGIKLGQVNMPARHVTRGDIIRTPHNLVFSCSPFKRWVWERAPYRDMICEDWAFWIEAAKNGARFQASATIDYEYVLHGHNITSRVDTATAEQYVRETFQ